MPPLLVHVFLLLLLPLSTLAEQFVFGAGCFWGMQHNFILLEQQQWKRTGQHLTTVAAYFGGNTTNKNACYYNKHDIAVYSEEGHGEVVALDITSLSHARDALKVYFNTFVTAGNNGIWTRGDYYDVGPSYRSMIGVPGGIHNNTIMNVVRAADPHNTTFVEGKGSDADTLGLNQVWVYNTAEYPIHQAELCLQFHDLQGYPKYTTEYHDLKSVLEHDGRLNSTSCPMPEIDSCL